MPLQATDLTGKRFGKLVVVSRAENRGKKVYWLCQCDCGNQKEVQAGHLTRGNIKSCGCASHKSIMDNLSDEEFAEIVANSNSLKQTAISCGYSNYSGASSNTVKARIARQNLDTSHFYSGEKVLYRTDEEVFREDSEVAQHTLRDRYKERGYAEYKCAICGQPGEWQGKELVLTLDHINGHNKDNRIENLRWVCPNCDRQLDTFAGRNIQRDEKKKNFCIDCGKEIRQSSTRCPDCSHKYNAIIRRTVVRPERVELKSLIRTTPFVQIASKFGVTDNTIRKWCDAYGLPRLKKEINAIKDSDWEAL